MVSIVVADDHKIVRQGLIRLLEAREDFTVVGEASDGEEAVTLVLQKRPDVVLMDINMPKLSGIDATRRLGEAGCPSKILVLSMHENPAYIEEVLRAGAAGYVVKASASKDVYRAIDAIQSGTSFLSAAISRKAVES